MSRRGEFMAIHPHLPTLPLCCAAKRHARQPRQLSFKGALQSLLEAAETLRQSAPKQRDRLWENILEGIANDEEESPRPGQAARQEATAQSLPAPDEAQETSPSYFAGRSLGLQEPPFGSEPGATRTRSSSNRPLEQPGTITGLSQGWAGQSPSQSRARLLTSDRTPAADIDAPRSFTRWANRNCSVCFTSLAPFCTFRDFIVLSRAAQRIKPPSAAQSRTRLRGSRTARRHGLRGGSLRHPAMDSVNPANS